MCNEVIINAYTDGEGYLAVTVEYDDNHQVTWWYGPGEYWPRAAGAVIWDDDAAEFDAHPAHLFF